MTSNNSFSELTDTLIRIIHQAVAIEHMPVDVGHGSVLTASEIHLIDVTGRFQDANLSAIASHLGVTKGAVTQMVQKLEQKGYLIRIKGNENKKTVYLHLTDKGKKAYLWHKDLHDRLNAEFQEDISGIPDHQIQATIDILKNYERILARSLEMRSPIADTF